MSGADDAVGGRAPMTVQVQQEQQLMGSTMKNQPQGLVLTRDAGRALDALVAEKVFGIAVVAGSHRHFYLPESDEEVAHYSTDLATAWLIVDAMVQRGFFAGIEFRPGDGWHVCFSVAHHDYRFGAQAAPLAICRASLAALEAQ